MNHLAVNRAASPVELVLERLEGVRRSGTGFEARCPAHADDTPSLSINEGSQGQALLKCHAGCSQDQVLDALEIIGIPKTHLFPHDREKTTTRESKVSSPINSHTIDEIRSWPWVQAVYEYQDERGVVRFLVVRTLREGKKSFAQYSPAESGRWRAGRKGVTPLLFRVPRILEARRNSQLVLVVEGEKDVESAEVLGFIATTNPGGAGKGKWLPDFSEILKNTRVAVIPDNDDPGREHATSIAASLYGVAAEIRIVELPEVGPKGDLTDWRRAGGTREQLMALIEKAPIWMPSIEELLNAGATEKHTTDLGNAKRLINRCGVDLRFCRPLASWYVWDGSRFCRDETGAVYRKAEEVVASIYAEAADADDSAERKRLAQWATRSESRDRLKAMVSLAEHQHGVPILPDQIDAEPWMLNVQNGILDLRTGELLPHRREALLTKISPVPYNPRATCPTWLAFLDRIMAGDRERVAFLQRAIGYTLTGNTSEQVLFFCYGFGKNGKSTLLDTVQALLGEDYATQATTEILMARNQAGHPTELARLKGARMVAAVEAEEGRRFNEPLLKQLTGGDRIAARFMRADFFEFRPEFKLWLAANHKPVIRGTDVGIWRRLRLIPFDVQIPESERDRHLPDRLRGELPGILSWALKGCLEWQRAGLAEPASVTQATGSYQSEMDVVGAFLDDVCVVFPSAEVKLTALYASYVDWCNKSGERPLTSRLFSARLTEKGFGKGRKGDGACILGIGLQARPELLTETAP